MGVATVPAISSVKVSGSISVGMSAKWYRTKNASLGVNMPSLNTLNGVSNCGGRDDSCSKGRFPG